MRTALLSARKQAQNGELRAQLTLGGRSVLAWQADCMRRLGCERVICLCDATGADLVAIQCEVEDVGLEFRAIRGALQLVGQVSGDHDLVIMTDGLVADPELAESLFADARGVACLPPDLAMVREHPEDFERIDAQRSWAGLAVVRANLIEKLTDLPADSDPVSMLLRLALQSGARSEMLDPQAFSGGQLLLASDDASLTERQRALIARSADNSLWTGPATALAERVVRSLAPSGLAQGPLIAGIAGGLLLFAALGIAALAGNSAIALGSAAIGSLALSLSSAFNRLKSRLYGEMETARTYNVLNILRDIAIIGSLSFLLPAWSEIVLAVIAIGLARLGGRLDDVRLRTFWQDRTVQLVLLAIAGGFGQLAPALAVLGLFALTSISLRNLQKLG